MYIAKAKVTSNSVDNEICLVTLDTYGLVPITYKVPSVNGIPLVKDDIVWILLDDVGTNPIILGKSFEVGNGDSVLFRSGNADDKEIKAYVNPDQFRLETKGASIEMRKDSIVLNDGAEAMVLGDTLKNLIGELIDEITKLTVGTALGPSTTPVNTPQLLAIKAKLSQMLSKKSKLE